MFDSSLVLEASRQRIEGAAAALGIEDVTDVIPEFDLGVAAQKDDGDWSVGPAFSIELGIFDRGQGRKAEALAELRRARQTYSDQAVRLLADTRAAIRRVDNTRERALRVQDVMLPLANTIVMQTYQHLNAMDADMFDLITARRQQMGLAATYILSLRDFWIARAEIQRLLQGGWSRESGPASGPLLTLFQPDTGGN